MTRTTGRSRLGRLADAHPDLAVDLAVLLPVCFLFLMGVFLEVFRRTVLMDEHLFINVGQGVLSHGYPWENYRFPEGRPFFDHTPLYSYFLALPATLAGPFGEHAAILAGRAMSALFGLGTVILTYVVARQGRGTVSGAVAAFLVATNPYFAHLSWVVHMEVPMAFFIVLGTGLLMHRRWLWAGIVVAVTVMLKEHSLAFWLPAGGYALIRDRWRAALSVTLPTVVSFGAVVLAAQLIDPVQLSRVAHRWSESAGGENAVSWRFQISMRTWAKTVIRDVVGLTLSALTAVAMAVALVRRARVPLIVIVPLGYSALTIVATFLIHLKEQRWLTGVIPMAALSIGLLVDWGEVARWLMRRDDEAASPVPPGPAA